MPRGSLPALLLTLGVFSVTACGLAERARLDPGWGGEPPGGPLEALPPPGLALPAAGAAEGFAPRQDHEHPPEHDWIRTDPDYADCCGTDDCGYPERWGLTVREVFPGEFLILPSRQVIREGDEALRWSRDERYRICLRSDGTARCLFRPLKAT